MTIIKNSIYKKNYGNLWYNIFYERRDYMLILFIFIFLMVGYIKRNHLLKKLIKRKNPESKTEMILHGKHILLNIFVLAVPIMLSNLLKSIHDVVDLYYVGEIVLPGVEQSVAEKSLEAMFSAINVTTPIINVCQALAMGFMVAGSALMSQYLGAGKSETAHKISAQLLLMCFVVGVIANVFLFIFAPNILTLMGAKDEIYKYSVLYVRYRAFELIGLFVFYAFQATRQSSGDTVTPVILNVISIILNIVFSGFFILVLKMDIRGAALGTVIANMLIIIPCILLLLFDKKSLIRLSIKDLVPNFKYIFRIFKLGLPAALSQAFTSLAFLLINSLMLSFESHIVAGISGGNKINSLLLFPAMAVGSVLATFVGQNVGIGNVKRAQKCVLNAALLSLIITISGSVILFFISKPMVQFVLRNTPDAVEPCMRYMYFLIVGLPMMGLFQIFIGTFQGAGRTGLGLILSSIRLWILRIPVIWFMINVLNRGESSVWYAMIISNFGAALIGLILYLFVDFKPIVKNKKKEVIE